MDIMQYNMDTYGYNAIQYNAIYFSYVQIYYKQTSYTKLLFMTGGPTGNHPRGVGVPPPEEVGGLPGTQNYGSGKKNQLKTRVKKLPRLRPDRNGPEGGPAGPLGGHQAEKEACHVQKSINIIHGLRHTAKIEAAEGGVGGDGFGQKLRPLVADDVHWKRGEGGGAGDTGRAYSGDGAFHKESRKTEVGIPSPGLGLFRHP